MEIIMKIKINKKELSRLLGSHKPRHYIHEKYDYSEVTDMSGLCNGYIHMTEMPYLDTSNVTNMGHMFTNCKSLKSIPLLDTSNVTNMNGTFRGCKSLKEIPNLDTSKVKIFNYIFSGCSELKTVPLIDIKHINIKNQQDMFNCCYSLENINPYNFPCFDFIM